MKDDSRIGDYLLKLLRKYDKASSQSAVSDKAGLSFSYVGLITGGKKNNPSRDVLIAICLAIGTTFEEVQYLLKYAGHSRCMIVRKDNSGEIVDLEKDDLEKAKKYMVRMKERHNK